MLKITIEVFQSTLKRFAFFLDNLSQSRSAPRRVYYLHKGSNINCIKGNTLLMVVSQQKFFGWGDKKIFNHLYLGPLALSGLFSYIFLKFHKLCKKSLLLVNFCTHRVFSPRRYFLENLAFRGQDVVSEKTSPSKQLP